MKPLRKPEYTLLEFTCAKGLIYAVVKTTNKNYALFGIRPLEDCINYLRSHHAKKFIIDDSRSETIYDMPQSKMETPKTTWFKGFAGKLLEKTTDKTVLRLKVESKYEIDHCIITDTTTIEASQNCAGNLIIHSSKYSGWYGSQTDGVIIYSPADDCIVTKDKNLVAELYDLSDKLYEQLNPEGTI